MLAVLGVSLRGRHWQRAKNGTMFALLDVVLNHCNLLGMSITDTSFLFPLGPKDLAAR